MPQTIKKTPKNESAFGLQSLTDVRYPSKMLH